MEKIKIFQVDPFADELFRGNPAAVCVLDNWLDAELMQNIAAENNLSETAFIVKKGEHYEIRWFSPPVEVDLCGHATLASAFVLFELLSYQGNEINFHSMRSGILKVTKEGELLVLDFPADKINPEGDIPEITKGIGVIPQEFYKGRFDYLAVLSSEEEVLNIDPDFHSLAKLKSRGLIVTAPGKEVDFVSRFFAPQTGIDEDPVTGSAHTTLIPYWSKRLNKKELTARQLSKRSGSLSCVDEGERVKIGGRAKLYMSGEIYTQ